MNPGDPETPNFTSGRVSAADPEPAVAGNGEIEGGTDANDLAERLRWAALHSGPGKSGESIPGTLGEIGSESVVLAAGSGVRWQFTPQALGAAFVLILGLGLAGWWATRPPTSSHSSPAVSAPPAFGEDLATLPPSKAAVDTDGKEVAAPSGNNNGNGDFGNATQIRVHVLGAVNRPAVVSVPEGSRVIDAVKAAGGLTKRANQCRINLAASLADGSQVIIPRTKSKKRAECKPASASSAPRGNPAGAAQVPSQGGAPPESLGTNTTAPGDTLDLNTATAEQFEGLPGIGPAIAGRILAWRQEHGGFTSVDQLLEVSGIGPATIEKLRKHVKV